MKKHFFETLQAEMDKKGWDLEQLVDEEDKLTERIVTAGQYRVI